MDAYRPPEAVLAEPRAPERPRRFRLLPVFVGGFLIDYLGTTLVSLVVAIPFAVAAVRSGATLEQMSQDVINAPLYLWPTTVAGSILTILGGYVAARWAANRYRLHGAAAGSVSLVLTLPFVITAPAIDTFSAWLTYASLIVQIPLATLGGMLAERRAA